MTEVQRRRDKPTRRSGLTIYVTLTALHRRFMAAWYDQAMARVEELCLTAWRENLLTGLSGTVLEIGAGTGANLPWYPASIERLILSEPDPYMRAKLQKKRSRTGLKADIIASEAEQLDLPEDSCDAVVATLVLCSVTDPARALNEIRRTLKPGGRLLFIEHVRAEHPGVRFWQQIWEPLWKRACGNCHLTRDTASLISQAGFDVDRLETLQMAGAPAIVRRVVCGVARKPEEKGGRPQK